MDWNNMRGESRQADIAEEWRQAVIAKGGFIEINDSEGP
jgi:hypothetical protein